MIGRMCERLHLMWYPKSGTVILTIYARSTWVAGLRRWRPFFTQIL